MDQPSSSLDQNVDLSKLSSKDKQELQQFIVNESQKARIQQCQFSLPVPAQTLLALSSGSSPQPGTKKMVGAVHNLTDICWKKCVTGSIRSGKLDKGEESCTQNCVDRFLDANFTVIKHLDAMRSQS
ncbi:import inner membrane translocase subunit TIM8 [Hyphodiscus hymeniophilus]|uniref:Mitochondrial import inner membrane translocase subunit n=1 Tax=Hyphodiscus hymeniophilus TaxID=353542 RepID=A0A9P6VIA2_9HELO|nr:import inner membrane translocase subunit TIM8 [Hyphodiscus hymeniophilus]